MANVKSVSYISRVAPVDFESQGRGTLAEMLGKLAGLGSALEQAEAGVDSLALVLAAAAHVFEGLYSLAWDTDNKAQQWSLARACESVIALLKAPAVLRHATVLAKNLQAVRVLGQNGKQAFDALIGGGACEGM